MTIRAMTAHDLPRVLEINEANVPEVGSMDMDRLQLIVDQSKIALVADLNREIAGFCLILGKGSTYDSVNYQWFMQRYTDAWYLDRVAFDASFQGQGLGTIMYSAVDAAIGDHRANGEDVARLTLEVNVEPPNEQSLAFHARRGFTEVGRQGTPYGIEVSLMHKHY